MATVDFTLEDLKATFITKDEFTQTVAGLATKDELKATRDELKGAMVGLATVTDVRQIVDGAVGRLKKMFEEDYRAEADRVTKLSRRVDKLARRP